MVALTRRLTLSLILFSFSLIACWAGPVSEGKALQVASRFASAFSPLRSNHDLQLVYTGFGKEQNQLRNEENPLFYVFNVGEADGFVIIAGDDNAYPVLGYADNGYFRAESMPSNLKTWLSHYEQEIGMIERWGITASAEINEQWASLSTDSRAQIDPGYLLPTAKWDQTEPYNDLCPMDSSERSVTGCVATTMAILMKYHEWPQKGKGSVSYLSNDKFQISENLSFAYDWSNMLDAYKYVKGEPAWNETQSNAVATLMYHCGVASFMSYSQESSGAYTQDAILALINNFRYDKGMYLAYRDLYTATEWHALMRKELDEGRPVMYGGQSEDSGHQFILDGYTEKNYYHLNWGWSGIANGYYLLSSLEPTWQGTGGSVDGAGFSMEQNAAIGLQKEIMGSTANHEIYFIEYGEKKPYGISVSTRHVVRNRPFALHTTGIMDYGMRDYIPYLGVFLESKDNVVKDTLLLASDTQVLPGGYYITLEGNSLMMETTLPVEEGDKIRMFYSSDKGKTWKPVRGKPGTITELPVYEKSPVSNQVILSNEIQLSQTETEVYLQSSDDAQITKVILYDISGNKVKEEFFAQGEPQATLSTASLKTGVYIVSVETTRGVSRYKIVRK